MLFRSEAFADVAVDLLSHPDRYDACSGNAVSFAREHDWNALLTREMDFIEGLAAQREVTA